MIICLPRHLDSLAACTAYDPLRASDPDGKLPIKNQMFCLRTRFVGLEALLDAITKYPKRPTFLTISKLLAKCHCGLIMTKRVFHVHQCLRLHNPEMTLANTIDLIMVDEEEQVA